jgi:tRNA threonylcarbamoyl adenosine modification protein YeaZ
MTQMLTLALDASTYSGTAAVLCGSAELGVIDVPMRNVGRETLLPAVVDLMQHARCAMDDVERIVCGSGPGSFTGLRIAAAIGKACAMRRGAREETPLYGVSSLMLIVAGNDIARQPGRYVAVLDALRGDVYAAAFEVSEQLDIVEIEATAVRPRHTIATFAAHLGAHLVGPDQTLRVAPHARGVARLESLLSTAAPADLATWEPEYGRPAAAQQRWEEAHGRPLGGV